MQDTNKYILLVEDDVVDAMTVKRSFQELGNNETLVHVTNGKEALDYLKNHSNKPSLILLDLNMPKMNGIEFLKEAKADHALHDIPIVVLTTSHSAHDVSESYQQNVAGYMTKPVDYKQFIQKMQAIKKYWTLSRLPNTN